MAQTAKDFLESAMRKLQSRDLAGAFADFDQAIALDPDFADAYIQRGIARDDNGDRDGAIVEYNKAIAIAPGSPEAYRNRGIAKRGKGDFAGAIADHDKAIALRPDYTAAFIARGLAKQDRRDFDGAVADYSMAISLDPEFPGIHRRRGEIRMDQGDLDGAISDYDQAIARQPDEGDDYLIRSTAHCLKGNFERELADLEKVMAIHKSAKYRNMARFRRLLGLRRLHREENRDAFAEEVGAWPEGWPKVVGEFLGGGLPEEKFLARAEKAAGQTPSEQRCEAFYYAGMMRLLAADRSGARALFEKCLATNEHYSLEFGLAQAELIRLPSG